MKQTEKSPDGTSFHDTTFDCSISTLRKILGEPQYECNDGSDKVNFDWTMETDEGDVFTVYDWKEYRALNENELIQWHIGGMSKRITDQAKREIREAIAKS
jgi:hypothetical protein